MSDDDERLKNLIMFKIPLTDKELGLDKPMPTWAIFVLVGIIVGLFIVAIFFTTR